MQLSLCLAMQKKHLGPGCGEAAKISAFGEPGSRDAQPGPTGLARTARLLRYGNQLGPLLRSCEIYKP
uniref:Uncharacterized protein n=1 Tax=Zea mays TaxID=4577 RepID=C0PC60_MAIZE|nr:unknown [Zea mays]